MLSSSSTPSAPNFGKMQVKELRAYLSARHMDCFGCMEKHEFVAKAKEACEASLECSLRKVEPNVDRQPRPETKKEPKKPKPGGKAGSKTSSKARAAPQHQSGDVLGFSMLFGVLVVGLWRFVDYVRRRCLRNKTSVCPITMRKIQNPYKLPCCRHLCERREIGKWMALSKYFRHRSDGQLERVAPCPLCKRMFEPTSLRSLLNELGISAPIDTFDKYAFDSGIADPAFPASAKERNFILLKTRDELVQEIQQQSTAHDQEESGDEFDSASVDEEPSEAAGSKSDGVDEPAFSGFGKGFLL